MFPSMNYLACVVGMDSTICYRIDCRVNSNEHIT